MKKIVFTQEEKDFIKESLLNKKSIAHISQELGYNRETISKEAKVIMGNNFDFKRKSYVNINYFEEINTPEKAYWLGFISADGYVVNNELNIQLQQSDKEHLKKFSEAINGNLTIRDINGKNNFNTPYHHYRVSIKSDKLIEDLSKYGIIQKKSLVLSKPPIKEEFYGYWILGYMDGDGCISKNKKKIRISFTGTENVLNFIKTFLNSKAKIGLEHRCENTFKIQLENDLSLNFLKKIDYINLPFTLERKKQIVSLYSSLI